jgi:hypothetical protein
LPWWEITAEVMVPASVLALAGLVADPTSVPGLFAFVALVTVLDRLGSGWMLTPEGVKVRGHLPGSEFIPWSQVQAIETERQVLVSVIVFRTVVGPRPGPVRRGRPVLFRRPLENARQRIQAYWEDQRGPNWTPPHPPPPGTGPSNWSHRLP